MALVPARILIVMGVSSSGKSVTGAAIARRLHASFLDGDDFHPPANKEKMRAGVALTDDDRWPWLASLARRLHEAARAEGRCRRGVLGAQARVSRTTLQNRRASRSCSSSWTARRS